MPGSDPGAEQDKEMLLPAGVQALSLFSENGEVVVIRAVNLKEVYRGMAGISFTT
jgi:hypothetical protein